MSVTNIISISLGVLSVILGIVSIVLAMKYKNLGDKLDEERGQILKAIQDKSVFSSIAMRDIHEKIISGANILNIHKDELRVWRNSKYNPRNVSDIIDKMNKELPHFLKQRYIDSIMRELNLNDEFSEIVVTLRHQYNIKDIEKIKELNDIFETDGISFDILIS